MSGYYLDEQYQCQSYPKEPILNCKTYNSLLICSECIQNYYIKNNICEPVE